MRLLVCSKFEYTPSGAWYAFIGDDNLRHNATVVCFGRIGLAEIGSIYGTDIPETRGNPDMTQTKLAYIDIAGFKSISAVSQRLEFGDITVLLGANGSGKSNLVSVFDLIGHMSTGALGLWVQRHGGADGLLFNGAKTTPSIKLHLEFRNEAGTSKTRTEYFVNYSFASTNSLFVEGEKVIFSRKGEVTPQEYRISPAGPESGLPVDTRQTSQVLYGSIGRIRTFQFHDTSETAKIRLPGYSDDNRYLRRDGGNTAAVLLRMRADLATKQYYERIVRHISSIMPQFEDFVLDHVPDKADYVRLNWKAKGSDYTLGPHQLSDGSLRYIALSTLLLQPVEWLPRVIVIDEPELGLHPAAIRGLAAMIRSASINSQVILATQSVPLVDEFDANNILIAEWRSGEEGSVYRRLDTSALAQWLENYSLSELWDKNVLGARP